MINYLYKSDFDIMMINLKHIFNFVQVNNVQNFKNKSNFNKLKIMNMVHIKNEHIRNAPDTQRMCKMRLLE